MSLPLNLDPLQPTSDFVDLKKCDQWHASRCHIAKHDLRVGIAEIHRALEDRGALSKMREKCALWFAPEDALQQTLVRVRQLCLSRQRTENDQNCCEDPPTPALHIGRPGNNQWPLLNGPRPTEIAQNLICATDPWRPEDEG